MEVEQEEAERRAGERERHPRDERLGYLRQERDRPERCRGDRRDTGREAIETVDEVQRDVHADDPEERERDGDGERELDESAAERVVDEVDVNACGDDDERDDRVAEELPARAEVERVVDEPDRHAEERGERGERESRGADLFRDEERSAHVAVDRPEQEDRQTECECDREAARSRDRPGVLSPAPRHVEHVESPREVRDEWREPGRRRERHERRQHIQDDRHRKCLGDHQLRHDSAARCSLRSTVCGFTTNRLSRRRWICPRSLGRGR